VTRARRLRVGLMPLLPLLVHACGDDAPGELAPESAGPAWFVEEAGARGLAFEHVSGHGERYWMPEIMGGGAALVDLDGDGDLDAYLVQSGRLDGEPGTGDVPRDRLYLNEDRGRFRELPRAGGAAPAEGPARYGMGVACGDVDGDGDPDLYLTRVGPCALFENTGSASEGALLRDASARAGVAHEGWSTSAAFLDFDRDGALDLFVARYLEWSKEAELACMDPLGRPDYCSPKNYKTPARDFLYRNLGGGRFEDVSRTSGVGATAGTGLGVACGDLDGDGWSDVFVANDGMPNHLWHNLGDGRFENTAMLSGCGTDANGLAKAGMGIALLDVDDDLDLDVFVCNLAGETDSYYRNEGGWFSDRTGALGMGAHTKPYTRFGIAVGDFDQDGRLDLYEANGRVERVRSAGIEGASDPYAEPNVVLRGLADGRFEPLEPAGGTTRALVATSRAVAQGDVDGDGALDLLVVNRDAPAHLLMNRVAGRGHWALLRVREKSGADALGATLEIALGERRVRRDVGAAYGYLSSHDPRVHLGLGSVERIDEVLVRWVDGETERFGPLEADRVHELSRGTGH